MQLHKSLDLFSNFDNALFYCVDPGAYAMFEEIILKINAYLPCKATLYCDGWSRNHAKFLFKPIEDLEFDLESLSHQKTLLVLGSQMNFSKTQFWIRTASIKSIKTLFIFDHWKNYTNHFVDSKDMTITFPDYIFVPDILAKDKLIEAFKQLSPIHESELMQKTIVSNHFSIEKSCNTIRSMTEASKLEFRLKLSENLKKMIVLLLEPDVLDPVCYPGYNTESILRYIKDYLHSTECNQNNLRIIVKPHPRQSSIEIEALLTHIWKKDFDWYLSQDEKTEALIAVADEVWGVTTVALIIADLLGKPIKSFQVNRNHHGKKQSNDYLEPYLIA